MANWYYFDENKTKQGPITDENLMILAQHGIIIPSTLVETEEGTLVLAGNINGLSFPVSNLGTQPPEIATNTNLEATKQKDAVFGCGCLILLALIIGSCLAGVTSLNDDATPSINIVQIGLSKIQVGMTESQAIEIMGSQPTRSHYQGIPEGYTSLQHVLIWETDDHALMVVCSGGKVIRVRDMSGINQNLKRNK